MVSRYNEASSQITYMRKPSIFVSSTCYDLKQLRADLHSYVEQAGFDPVLSEYPSFPVDPDQTTVENCRKAVEKRADVFVLVIGGRYGSMNEYGKSVTNLEYITARAKGIPVYVFVMRSIIDLLVVWKANPKGNFSSVVDSPKLLEFVAEIRGGGGDWVFAFDTAQDIITTLRTQLAYLFADALELRTRASASGVLAPKYNNLAGRELRLIIEKPNAWEYQLFSEALQREILASADLRRDWTYNLALGADTSVTPSQLFNWMLEKTSEVQRIMANLQTLFDKALPIAIGPIGTAGDPEKIVYVASRAGDIYRSLLHWKLDFFRRSPPEEFLALRSLAACLCDNTISEIEEFAVKLSNEIADALNTPPSDSPIVLTVNLTLTVPNQSPLTEEITRLRNLVATKQLEWR